jgi:hypothetical protein
MSQEVLQRYPYVWVRSLSRPWLVELLDRAASNPELDIEARQFAKYWRETLTVDPTPIEFPTLKRILDLAHRPN